MELNPNKIKPLGIDGSYTGTGVSCGKETIVVPTVPNSEQTTSQNCQRRSQEIVLRIVAFVNKNYDPDDEIMIVVEGPSFGNANHGFENGWLMNEFYNRLPSMIRQKSCIIEVPPSTLKKAIAGKGNADKEMMKAAVKEKYGMEFELDRGGNKCDAYSLYKFGVGVLEGTIAHHVTKRRGQGGRKKKKAVKK